MKFKQGITRAVGGIFVFLVLFSNAFSFDDKPGTNEKKTELDSRRGYIGSGFSTDGDTRWGFKVMYGEKGFGLSGEYHIPAWKNTDLFANLGFSGVTDDREFQEYDVFGNSYTPNKVNRVFTVPLTLGVKHYLFQDDLDGSMKPTFSLGVAPTLVLTNPASTGFFHAIGKFNAAFAMGGFAGIGMDFMQTQGVAFSFNVNYYYLPVIGKEVMSLENKPINNLGGLQFTIGLNLLN